MISRYAGSQDAGNHEPLPVPGRPGTHYEHIRLRRLSATNERANTTALVRYSRSGDLRMLAAVIRVLGCVSGAVAGVAARAAAEDGYENAPGEFGRSGADVAQPYSWGESLL